MGRISGTRRYEYKSKTSEHFCSLCLFLSTILFFLEGSIWCRLTLECDSFNVLFQYTVLTWTTSTGLRSFLIMRFLSEEHALCDSALFCLPNLSWPQMVLRCSALDRFPRVCVCASHFHVVLFNPVSQSKPSGEPFAHPKARRPKQTAPNKVVTGTSTGSKLPVFQKYELEEHHSCLTLKTACFNGEKELWHANIQSNGLMRGTSPIRGGIRSVSSVDLKVLFFFFILLQTFMFDHPLYTHTHTHTRTVIPTIGWWKSCFESRQWVQFITSDPSWLQFQCLNLRAVVVETSVMLCSDLPTQ